MGNITGQNFREWVNNQITIRQQKLGATQKDADNVAWQTNSTAWLRLCSSVNVSREKSKELTGTENNSGAELAKKYVLFGGVNSSSSNWDPKSGVLSSPYTALNSNVYGFDSDESRALVPMPGLISATVTPMNRGALKKAQIRIKCHSQEQFAILDSLYMRPGYTILLEWGHTMYFDNSGNLVSTPEFNTPAYENIINRKGTQDDILKNIDTERSSTDGNYDGFFGKITNFDWSFQTDGTYDITVNAISIGDVIETLNINNASFKATSNVAKGENDDTADSNEEAVIGDFIANKDKSQLNNWLYYLYNKLGERTKQGVGTTKGYSGSNSSTYTSSYSKIFFRKSFTGGKSKREAIRVNNKVLPSEEGASVIIEEASYIRLGALLKYIQDYLLIYSNKDGKKTPYLKIDWDYSTNYCFTFPEQYSVDPTVCVIPFKQPFSKNGKYIHGKYGVIWENLLGNAFRDTKSDFVGKLMNIHINFNFIDTCIQNNLNQGELALLAFLESLMKGVQRALGDVNKFSVTYDGEENSIKIYDEIPLDPKVTGKKGELALFNTFGVKENLAGSFITNITLNATISSEFATMISIGAQARNDGKKANTSTLTRFNEGLVDGIIPTKLTERVASSSQDEEKTFDEVYTDSYKKVWKAGSILLDFYWKNNKPTKEGTDTEYSVMSELFRTLAANYNKKNGVGGIEGFLPFNLGLEMKGLSGPRIYEKYFITGEILPNSYPKNLAFLVKGLQHDINLEGWKTTIDSMAYQSVGEYISLPPTPPEENQSGGQENNGEVPNADRLREVLTSLGYKEKGEEISNGGDISDEMYKYASSVFRKIKELYPDIVVTVTGGNDAYHQKLSYTSSHKLGNGLDFVIKPLTSANKNAVDKILGGFVGGNQDQTVSFINEYDHPSSAATAGHFHIRIGGRLEGGSRTKKYIALANNGEIDTYLIA